MGQKEPSRTAIVTGAGKRVGAEIARGLLADGWTVVAHVHHDADEVPSGAVKVVADLVDAGAAESVFAAAHQLPAASLLVNNAARFAFDSLDAFDSAEFDTHMAVNVRSPLLLSQRFARQHPSGDALIVNILDSKLAAPNPDYLSYTLSKQALAGVTELSARALAGQGIRVNAIAPALMLRSPGQSEENFEAMHRANPLGRGVEPSDVLAAVRYLVEARTVTGQCLILDGGQRFMRLDRDVQFLGDR
jgi:NAD(P)-dependent dehydrogenase (short-subunit alcohol dehydrogenase family)